jgi:hypothetical protein
MKGQVGFWQNPAVCFFVLHDIIENFNNFRDNTAIEADLANVLEFPLACVKEQRNDRAKTNAD